MDLTYWEVDDFYTGSMVLTNTRESAEKMFEQVSSYGHEAEMYRVNEDDTRDLIKRYGGDLKKSKKEREKNK